jgi:hypothetical protein
LNRIPAYLADSGLFSGIFRVNWRTAAAFRIGVVSSGSEGVKGQKPLKSCGFDRSRRIGFGLFGGIFSLI